MTKLRLSLIGLFVFAFIASARPAPAAPQDANFAGTWQLSITGGGGKQQGGNQAARVQSITITQDGDKYKVNHSTRRGENAYDATVSGNTISWTEVRQRRNGGTMNVQFTATLDGDTLKGTMNSGQFSREFTATRQAGGQ